MDLHGLAQQLRERAQTLQREIAAKGGHAGASLPEVGDLKDAADGRSRQAVDEAEVERDRAELRDIATALRLIVQGVYGRCIDCDATIPAARLAAQPAAVRCLACQQALERA